VVLKRRLRDAERLAAVTSRIALAGPVESLQRIQRDIEGLAVPPCARRARYLLASEAEMDATGFLSFMAGGSEADSLAAVASASAQEHGAWFDEALREVADCAPDCPHLVGWTEDAERARIKQEHDRAALAARTEAEEKAQTERDTEARRVQREEARAAAEVQQAERQAAEMKGWERQHAAALASWYRQLYLPAIIALRAATTEADAAFKKPGHEGLELACGRIGAAASRALARRVVKECPDAWAAQRTKALLDSYTRIAEACNKEDWGALEVAGREMAKLTDAMRGPFRPYGLEP
jgi:hypothetical protein